MVVFYNSAIIFECDAASKECDQGGCSYRLTHVRLFVCMLVVRMLTMGGLSSSVWGFPET